MHSAGNGCCRRRRLQRGTTSSPKTMAKVGCRQYRRFEPTSRAGDDAVLYLAWLIDVQAGEIDGEVAEPA